MSYSSLFVLVLSLSSADWIKKKLQCKTLSPAEWLFELLIFSLAAQKEWSSFPFILATITTGHKKLEQGRPLGAAQCKPLMV